MGCCGSRPVLTQDTEGLLSPLEVQFQVQLARSPQNRQGNNPQFGLATIAEDTQAAPGSQEPEAETEDIDYSKFVILIKLVPPEGGKAAQILTDNYEEVIAWENTSGQPGKAKIVFTKFFPSGWASALHWIHKSGEKYNIRIWELLFHCQMGEESKKALKAAKKEQSKVHKTNMHRNMLNYYTCVCK